MFVIIPKIAVSHCHAFNHTCGKSLRHEAVVSRDLGGQ